MALEIDEAGVRFIVQNLEGYLSDLSKANDATKDVGTKTEQAATSSGIAWGKIGKAAAVAAAAVATAAVAIGVAALKLAGDFDEAYDSIQVTTGATGKDLVGLQDSFKNVFSSIPADGGDVAKALAAINQKTGATGQPLENLTKQIVELSRITGTDLDTNLETVLDATQRWGVSAETAAPMLDHLFRVSQESGVPVSDLAQSLSDNKAVLDALGLTLPDAATLIGGLGKAGIDADEAFGGLTIALRKMAKDGVEDPQAAMAEYFQRIKDAPTDAAAAAIGADIFGRSAIGLSSAIRDGTFDMDTFTAAVGDNKNGIIDTAEQTNDWREKLDILKNKLLVELEPALMAVFDAVTEGVEKAGPQIEKFRGWFEENVVPAIKEAARVFEEDWLPVIERVGQTLQAFWDEIGSVIFEAIVTNVQNIGAVIKETGQLIGSIIDGDWSAAFDHLKELVTNTFEAIKGYIEGFYTVLAAAGTAAFTALYDAADAVFGDLIRGISEWMNERVIEPIASFTEPLRTKGAELFGALWDGMSSIGSRFYELGSDIVGNVIQGLIDNWGRITSWITDHLPSPDDLLPDWLGMVAPPRRPWHNPNDVPDPWTDPNRPIIPDWWTNPENDPRTPFLPPDKRPQTQPQVTKPQSIPPGLLPPDQLPGEPPKLLDTTKLNIDAITDPAQFLQLVMNAIATIEALADANVPNIAKPKLKRLATNLRNIIVEFGNAMKGVKAEAAETAAIMAGFMEPILRAVEAGIDTVAALADSSGGVGLPKIRKVLDSIANITRQSVLAFGAMDVAKLSKTADASAYVADIVENVRRAADALLRDKGLGGGTDTIPGTTGGGDIPGAIGGAAQTFAQILAGIVAGLPPRGSTLAGAPGGTSYTVNATYVSPQNPGSIRLDLAEIAMRAAA